MIRIWVWDSWEHLVQCHTASSNSPNSWVLSTYKFNVSFSKSNYLDFFYNKRKVDRDNMFIPPRPKFDGFSDNIEIEPPKYYIKDEDGGFIWASPMDSMEFKEELKRGYNDIPSAGGTDGVYFEYYIRYGKETY